MDIVIDEIVAVLKVLSFRDTVGCYKDINDGIVVGHQEVLVLRYWREASEHGVQIATELRNSRATFNAAGYHSRVEFEFRFYILAYIFVQVFGSIRKGCKDYHLRVAGIDGVLNLV